MTNPARLATLLLLLALTGCDQNAIEQRAIDISRRNETLDRKCSTIAAKAARRVWIIEGNDWYAQADSGAIVRLESPQLRVEPIHEGRPFYSGWQGHITIFAPRWECSPPIDVSRPFQVKYRAVMKDVNHCDLELVEGWTLTRPDQAALAAIKWPAR